LNRRFADFRSARLVSTSFAWKGRSSSSRSYGSCTACGHRQLPEAIGNQYHASSRDGPRHHGNFLNNVDPRRRAVTCLRTELSPCVCHEPPSEGRCANCRSGPRLQKVEPISDPQAFAFESGRVGRSRVEEDPLKLSMHRRDRLNLPIRRTSHISNR
jgi:hypothetical protein